MRRLLLLLLLVSTGLHAQTTAVRFDSSAETINAQSPQPGGMYPVLAVSGARVQVCNAPANGIPCTNLATTYQSAAASSTCPGIAQLTWAGSTACQGTADQRGGFGAWLLPGAYQYIIFTRYGSYGPYDLTLAGGSGGGGTITGVTAGTGLSGGGTTGSVTVSLTNPVPILLGGTGTATPGLTGGTGISVTGSWPNQMVSSTSTTIASIQITTATSAISANSCTGAVTATMTGVATTSTFEFTPTADASAAAGWGTGVLFFVPWPTSNTLNYKVCNGSSSSVTPGTVTWNVSAR